MVVWQQGANQQAKELCRDIDEENTSTDCTTGWRDIFAGWIKHIAIAGAWDFKHCPKTARPKKKHSARKNSNNNPDERGHHDVRPRHKGGIVCINCMREAWTTKGKNRLRKISCSGNAAGAAHHTHNLSTTRGIVWCIKCGGHTSRMPRTLRNPCLGTARSPAYRNVMQRLASGRLPTEGQERQTDSGGQREQQDWDKAKSLEEKNLRGHKNGGSWRSTSKHTEEARGRRHFQQASTPKRAAATAKVACAIACGSPDVTSFSAAISASEKGGQSGESAFTPVPDADGTGRPPDEVTFSAATSASDKVGSRQSVCMHSDGADALSDLDLGAISVTQKSQKKQQFCTKKL